MDSVTIVQGSDSVIVTDPTTNVPVTITEETVIAGSEVSAVNIGIVEEVFNVKEEVSTISVTDKTTVVKPSVAEVQVQIIEDISVPYAKRTEFVGEDKIYKGRAIPGSLDSDPVWQVWLVTITNIDEGDNNDTWADGNANFDNVWNDYLTLEYT